MTLNGILKSYDRYLATLKELNDKAATLTEFDCGYFSIREDEGGELSIVDGVAVKQDKNNYAIYDIEDTTLYECNTIEEVNEKVDDLTQNIYEGYDGLIPFEQHLKVYKQIETVSFVEDEEATKEEKTPMGMWETKSC